MRSAIFTSYLDRSIVLNSYIEYVNNYTVLINDADDLKSESIINEILKNKKLSLFFAPEISRIPLSRAYSNAEYIYLKYTTISSIPDFIFKDTQNLRKVVFPDSLTSISFGAFYNSSIEEIEANNLSDIVDYAFYKSNIKSFEFTNLNYIGSFAFAFTGFDEIYIDALKVNQFAFYNCLNLAHLNISTRVLSLGEMSFAYTNIKNFIYPATLKDISTAFSYCLENLIVEENVWEISILNPHYFLKTVKFMGTSGGADIENQPILETIELSEESYSSGTFTNCPKLINVINLGNVHYISSSGFESCTSLKEVNLTRTFCIYSNAFRNCINLETLIGFRPEEMDLEGGVFIGCVKLKNYNYSIQMSYNYEWSYYNYYDASEYFPFEYSGIEKFVLRDDGIPLTLRGCTNLKFVDLSSQPNLRILEFCFYGCTNLTQIKFADNASVIIGAFAFANTGFEEFELHEHWTVNNYAFANCKNLKTLKFNRGVSLRYTVPELEIKEQPFICPIPLDDYKYTLGQFWGCTALYKIILAEGLDDFNFHWICSNTISEIELEGTSAYEFNDMTLTTNSGITLVGILKDLEIYTVPSSIYEILPCAFSKCQNLKSVIIPTTIQSLNATFMFCKNLEHVIINSDVKTLGDMTFYGCTNLISITLANPNKVQELGMRCFYNSIKLVSIPHLPSLAMIGDSCFKQCESFTGLNIDLVQHIPDSCFYGTKISAISVSSHLLTIGNYSFYGTLLNSFSCPENLEMIGFGAFAQCLKLSVFSFNSKISSIQNQTFINCTELKSISIPDNIVDINNDAFIYCSNLEISFTSGNHPCFMIDSNCFMTQSGELIFMYGKPKPVVKISSKVTMLNQFSINREDIRTKYSYGQLLIQEGRSIVELPFDFAGNYYYYYNNIPLAYCTIGINCNHNKLYENKYAAIEDAFKIGYIVNNSLYNPNIIGGISRIDALTETITRGLFIFNQKDLSDEFEFSMIHTAELILIILVSLLMLIIFMLAVTIHRISYN